MQKLLNFILGIKAAPWAQGGRWHVEWSAMPKHDLALLLLCSVLLAAVGVLWLYKKEGRSLTFPVRAGLAALRMVVLLGVVAMLLEPVIVFSKLEWVPSNLVVLRDVSGSMELKDAYPDQNQASRISAALKLGGPTELRDRTRTWLAERALENGLLDALRGNGDRQVDIHEFAAQMSAGTTTRPSTPEAAPPPAASPDASDPPAGQAPRPSTDANGIDRSATAIGTVIRQAIAAYRGQPLAGILLISDGQNNAGETASKAAEFAAGEGVPIVALASGTPEGPRNAKLTKLEVSPVVFVKDPNPVRVVLESRGLAKSPATVVLERRREGGQWEEIGRQPITLEEEGQVQTVPFEFKEDRPGKMELRATITDVGPELTTDDNVAVAEVRVIRQKMKVLFIAGSTFPEVEFLRNSLMRDQGISASTWLMAADAAYEQPGDPPIRRLPNTQEELDDYDCVVLYDPDPAGWPINFPQMLEDFVGKAGGGLVYICGERETKNLFDRQDDPANAWLSMLPVVVEPGLYQTEVSMKLSSREAWNLDITPEGRADPIFQFSTKPEDNEQILSGLPGMYWHFPVTRAKPGATVLARHGDPRMRNEHGPHVLLATQLVGPGRTVFIAFDSTYRWRYLDEQYFDGFWARVVDRAGRNKMLGGRYPYTLSTDRSSYRPGSQVTLTARFDNPNDRDAGLDSLHGEFEVAGQDPTQITLTPRHNESGTFEATFPVSHPGPHTVRVWSGDPDVKGAKAATLQFQVELPNLEYDRPTLDLATLNSIAKPGGGAVYDLTQADQIPAAFKVKRVARILEDRHEIWDAPVLVLTILAAVFAEWILRKKYRMV